MHMSPTLGSVDAKSTAQQKQSKKDEPTDAQCKRVDVLLNKLVEKYPYRVVAGKVSGQSLYVCGVRLCNHKNCCFPTQDGSKPVPGGCGRSVHTSMCVTHPVMQFVHCIHSFGTIWSMVLLCRPRK